MTAKKSFLYASLLALPVFVLAITNFHIPILAFGVNLDYWLQFLLSAYVILILGFDLHQDLIADIKKLKITIYDIASCLALILFFYSFWAMLAGRDMYFWIADLIMMAKFQKKSHACLRGVARYIE